MLGYPFGTKGYRLLDLMTSQIFVSRDVIFHETIFPFQPTQTTPTIPTLLDMQSPVPLTQSPAIPLVVIPTPFIDSTLPPIPSSPQSHSSPQPHSSP